MFFFKKKEKNNPRYPNIKYLIFEQLFQIVKEPQYVSKEEDSKENTTTHTTMLSIIQKHQEKFNIKDSNPNMKVKVSCSSGIGKWKYKEKLKKKQIYQ